MSVAPVKGAPWVFATLLMLLGIVLGGGGMKLALLHGSLYYLVTGVVLVAAGVLLWWGRRVGMWLYLAIIAYTVIWSLWEAGLDFEHGTGHGVGSYLSVHEGPARLSKLGTVALQRGMILSNEPGYYKTGAYGIRIENLVLVTEGPAGAEKKLNAFETLTLAPIDRRLVDMSLLTVAEIVWLDAYHARVAEALMPLVDEKTGAWLKAGTLPLQ